jgi:hypothetical protein
MQKNLKIFFLVIIVVFFSSCSERIYYESKNGNNDILIDNKYIIIQRSTEVLGGNLHVSHNIDSKTIYKSKFILESISDSISNIVNYSEVYVSCSFKKLKMKFENLPDSIKNFSACSNLQFISFFSTKNNDIGNPIYLHTKLVLKIENKDTVVNIIDTLFKKKYRYMPHL